MLQTEIEKPSIKISELLVGIVDIKPQVDCSVSGLSIDSRSVTTGDLFIAKKGLHTSGHKYIADAINAGAVAVVWDASIKLEGKQSHDKLDVNRQIPIDQILMLPIENLNQRIGQIAACFYRFPSMDLDLVAITGTNGKTSCCQYIAHALNAITTQGVGVIGTLGYGQYDQLQSADFTTPDALQLQSILADLKEQQVTVVVLEASSHGLDQGRLNGVNVKVAVFTNLSRDHLDYHGDLQSYAKAKKRLFELPTIQYAVINLDDEFGVELLAEIPSNIEVLTFGLACTNEHEFPKVYGSDLRLDKDGLELQVTTPWGKGTLKSALLGRYNASNLLASLATLLALGKPLKESIERLSGDIPVAGRLQRVVNGQHNPIVIIDFAHSPDALKNVLYALAEHKFGNIVCVFGCGGDRDRGKRSAMGEIAEQHSDQIILTDDNPRSEDAKQIISDILTGMKHPERATVIHDRGKAIANGIEVASMMKGVALIAGKGHETVQIVGDRKIPFNDFEHASACLMRSIK